MRSSGFVLLVSVITWSCTGGTELTNLSEVVEDMTAITDGNPDELTTTEVDVAFEPEDASFELDAGLDLAEVDLWSPDQWDPCPGYWPCACESDDECNYGLCLWQCDAYRCTLACTEDCPMGYSCKGVSNLLPDMLFICAPDCMDLCKPCHDSKDCNVGWCLPHGQAGNFCSGPSCWVDEDCPEGYVCQEATDVSGNTDTQCVLAKGECTCNQGYIDEAAGTTCFVENEFGTCYGERYCAESGLTPCDATIPEAEICDGVDNDCDTVIDEKTGGGECFITNSHGSCPGTVKCIDGGLHCDGEPAGPEECDGIDNNCNGQVDEFFPDYNNNGIPDCIEGDDDLDNDGISAGIDNCTQTYNPGQEDHDNDTVGDACDDDDDNDGVADPLDCAPLDIETYPGAVEVCDGKDNNCNFIVDEGFPDLDGDGWKDCIDDDVDGDGFPAETDCAPLDPKIFPDALEVCDGKDNNCNDVIDEEFTDTDNDDVADCVDNDLDGDEIPNETDNCPASANPSQSDQDNDTVGDACDSDLDGDAIPNTLDNCLTISNTLQSDVDNDGLGDACDEDEDGDEVLSDADNCPLVPNPLQEDQDNDGIGDACEDDLDGDGSPDAQDCAPQNPSAYPGNDETCDGIDNNCNNLVDEGYPDTDLDGLKNCTDPDDDNDGDADEADCAPLDNLFHSNAPEVCDGLDNDCDDKTDEETGQLTCGKGECLHTIPDCIAGQPQTCDPAAGIAKEICDGLDNDCDGLTDEDQGVMTCGKGECVQTIPACGNGGPNLCDPFLGASDEICDGLDNDCDGQTDEEMPLLACGKGQCFHTVSSCVGGIVYECNPFDGASLEVCDGQDNDCDGDTDEDLGTSTCGLGTCEHTVDNCANAIPQMCNPFVGASQEVCDGQDNDCNGLVDEYFDLDGDGVKSCDGDCDDQDWNNWESCATCQDGDEDGYWGKCDKYQGINGPDCNDTDPDNWTGCDDCVDSDEDGYFIGCDAYSAIIGPDCGDDDPDNWVSCDNCIDVDEDDYYVGCDAYTLIAGPDCFDDKSAYNPGAEPGCDGEDYNCDGMMDNDDDEDGFPDAACGGDDCNDADSNIKPDPAGGCAVGRTCQEILDSGAADGDGIYTVDTDGWDSGEPPFHVYCDMTTNGGGWTLVYKLSKDQNYDIVGLWNDNSVLNEDSDEYLDVGADGAHYKNRLANLSWSDDTLAITAVALQLYTAEQPVQTLQFDASGTSKTNWYTQAKITESSWTDIIAQPKNYFSIPGDSGNGRHWYINRNYSGCGNDAGWLVVDRGSHPCTWESKHDPSISILYAVPATYQNWNAAGIAEADVFAIFVR